MNLVNGHSTKAVVEIVNNEDTPINVVFVGGTLSTTQPLPEDAPAQAGVLRNLSARSYDVDIEPGETRELPFPFVQDMQPQDVFLDVIAVLRNSNNQIFQVKAHTGLASIVEAPISVFDPQMYVTFPPIKHFSNRCNFG